RRSYSFSSAPGIDPEIAVTVQRIPNGHISRLLHDQLKPGDSLYSLPPSGRFTIDADPSRERQVFFIAAGSGITPVFCLIKKMLMEEPRTQLILVDQNRDESSIIFKDQLLEIQKKHPQTFQWINLLSRPLDNENISQRLTNFFLEELIRTKVSEKRETLFYICGPPSFMRMAHFTLRLMGFSDDQVRRENFRVDYMPAPPMITDNSPKQIRLQYKGQTHQFEISYPTNILQGALNNHIQLPYSCRGGRCSTCVARCLSGQVILSINEVLTDKDLQEGLVLTCVGYAMTDLDLTV
ncbi:MAG TPA: iron-sulfur cluster-binding domain-containing protein, partial [Puia sp.]|nr:iron-sulfur cluster-binding domain-containing protein [Puia sp.]